MEATTPDLPVEDHKGASPFVKRVGLTTAIFAVILSISALYGGNNTKDMILAQQKASNQWSYFQAKSIRQHLYRSQIALAEMGLVERGATLTAAIRRELEQRIAKLKAEVARFEAEKKVIMKVARGHEKDLDIAQTKDPYLDYSQVFLQIAIILASIAMIASSGRFFLMSLLFAGIGTFLLADGIFMFLRFGLLH